MKFPNCSFFLGHDNINFPTLPIEFEINEFDFRPRERGISSK